MKYDEGSVDEAIIMLEEVIEALQKRQLDPREAVSVDSSTVPLPRG